MSQAPIHRDRLISSATELFRRQGYAGTGLKEILAASGAPKGSLYHYFPGGKEELGVAAVRLGGRVVSTTLEELLADTATVPQFLDRYCTLLAGWMRDSSFQAGCPVATVLLETAPGSEPLAEAGREVFASWEEIIARAFERDGFPRAEALEQARFVLSVIEGALLRSRVEQSTGPIEQIPKMLPSLSP